MKLAGVFLILAAALGCAWFFEHGKVEALRDQNERVRAEIRSVSSDLITISNELTRTRAGHTASVTRLSEVLRLRGEVTKLKSQVEELKAAAVSAAASTSAPPAAAEAKSEPVKRPVAGAVLPREQWGFAGYDTPEGAMQTTVWAMSRGDVNTFTQGLSVAARQAFQKEMEGKSEAEIAAKLIEQIRGTSALRLDRRKEAPPGSVAFVLSSTEQDDGAAKFRDEQILVLKQIGDDWKVTLGPEE